MKFRRKKPKEIVGNDLFPHPIDPVDSYELGQQKKIRKKLKNKVIAK